MGYNTLSLQTANVHLVIPILPGQTEAWRRFVQELEGPQRVEWTAWCNRIGLTQLRVWLQSSQKGAIILLRARVRAGVNGLLDDKVPFDRWLREQVLSVHGVDIAQFRAEIKRELILEIQTEKWGGKYDQLQ